MISHDSASVISTGRNTRSSLGDIQNQWKICTCPNNSSTFGTFHLGDFHPVGRQSKSLRITALCPSGQSGTSVVNEKTLGLNEAWKRLFGGLLIQRKIRFFDLVDCTPHPFSVQLVFKSITGFCAP